MRRFVSLIGSLILALSIVGCGSSDEKTTEDTTSIEDSSVSTDTVDEDNVSPLDAMEDTTIPGDAADEDIAADIAADLGVEDLPLTDIAEDVPGEDTTVEDILEDDGTMDVVEDIPEDVSAQACNNDADNTYLAENNPVEKLQECGVGCADTGGDCILNCFKDATDLSDGCAVCFAMYADCVVANCMDVCMTDESQECDPCQAEHCAPDFETCAGITFN